MSIFMNKEEKELLKKFEEEEKELDKDLPKEDINIFEILKNETEEEEELNSYLTEEEINSLNMQKKEEKRILIIAASTLSTLIIILTIGLSLFSYFTQSDLQKITKPAIKKYYKNNMNIDIKAREISNLCKEDNCSDIALLTTKDNHHIITLDNKSFGDDYNTSDYIENYKKYLHEYISDMNIINTSPTLSYKDYYIKYNAFYDYINVLPNNTSIETLINSHKLTVIDTIAYQGNCNFNKLTNLINNLSRDSIFYLINHEKGIPINLTILKQDSLVSLDINTNFEISKGIIYHELDKKKNKTVKINVNEINDNDILTTNNYKITNGYNILIENNNQNKESTSYFMLQFDNSKLLNTKLKQLEYQNYNNIYKELEIDEYQNIILFKIGGSTYLIGESEVSFGFVNNKEPFWCKLNLC